MTVISVVGTSGIGKSFLVKQLAALNCQAAFFEGEQGVFPDWVLKSVASGEEPLRRIEYFINRYKDNLTRARTISQAGEDAYIDGAMCTIEAIKRFEDKSLHEDFKRLVDDIPSDADIIVFLHADEAYLREQIAQRGREEEQSEQIIGRALAIQESFFDILEGDKRVIGVERSDKDFEDYETLTELNQEIEKKKIP